MAYCYQLILLRDAFLTFNKLIIFPGVALLSVTIYLLGNALNLLHAVLFCMLLLSSVDFFSKLTFLKNLLQEQYQSLKRFASKLFADKSHL